MALPLNFDSLPVSQQIALLRAENEALKAAKPKGRGKDSPAYISNGIVHFPGIGGLTGLHLNPDAFTSLIDRMGPVVDEFVKNEGHIRAEYAKRPAYEPKSRIQR